MPLLLRPYQEVAVALTYAAWGRGVRRPALVLPTGAGKTIVFATIAEHVWRERGERTLVLVHTTELVDQAVEKLHNVAPDVKVGVVKAERNEHEDAHVIVATVQTLRSAGRLAQIRDIGVVVVDEAHHATAVSYRTVLDHFDCLALGVTATMGRSDGAALGDVWDEIIYSRDIVDMIHDGYLLPIRGKRVYVPDFNLNGVKRVAGDYAADGLADALSDALAPELAAKAYLEHAPDRSGLLFTPTVASAYEFADAFNDAGIKTETVHGALPKDERLAILARLRTGATQVVSNCMVLTEGFDEPRVSCIVMARPTTSVNLYVQMAGRALRLYPGQTEALLLDLVGVSSRHKLAGPVDLAPDNSKRIRDDVEFDTIIGADGLDFEYDEPESSAGGGGSFPLTYVHGDDVKTVDVDLFGKSHRAWLETASGVHFLPLPGRKYEEPEAVFLAPDGGSGLWVVATVNANRSGVIRYRRMTLDAAMAWGESLAREHGAGALTNSRGAWRKKDVPPTQAQLTAAGRMGIDVTNMSKAEVSDAMTRVKITRLVDPIIRRWS